MATSSAIAQDRISRVLGYQIKKGFFNETTPYLPQRIVVLAEANTANQANVDPSAPFEFIDEASVGNEFGFGSPAHQIARILRPKAGGGVGSVSTVIYAQDEDVAAVAAEVEITVTGPATQTVTHFPIINGRSNVDGVSYGVNILVGDTDAIIAGKIADAINAVPGAPCTAAAALGVVTLTSKWAGVTSDELNASVDTDGLPGGVSYAVVNTTAGSGTADITASLNNFGNTWNTLIINSFKDSAFLNQLEVFNGRPDANAPTGRYTANIFKPFVALFGNTDSTTSTIELITDTPARKIESTNAICPAPNSDGFSWEAAANVGALVGPVWNNSPHLDVSGQLYPDMPTALTIGDFSTYDGRDNLVKKGSSTVDLVSGKYQIQEIVTTYHPVGEEPAQFRYIRNLNIDWNIKYGLDLLADINVVDHMVADDNAIVGVDNVIKPKQWKQIISSYASDLQSRGLIVDAPFMVDSIEVTTGNTNPDRLDTAFKYKRSPYARVISITAVAGFSFGNN